MFSQNPTQDDDDDYPALEAEVIGDNEQYMYRFTPLQITGLVAFGLAAAELTLCPLSNFLVSNGSTSWVSHDIEFAQKFVLLSLMGNIIYDAILITTCMLLSCLYPQRGTTASERKSEILATAPWLFALTRPWLPQILGWNILQTLSNSAKAYFPGFHAHSATVLGLSAMPYAFVLAVFLARCTNNITETQWFTLCTKLVGKAQPKIIHTTGNDYYPAEEQPRSRQASTHNSRSPYTAAFSPFEVLQQAAPEPYNTQAQDYPMTPNTPQNRGSSFVNFFRGFIPLCPSRHEGYENSYNSEETEYSSPPEYI